MPEIQIIDGEHYLLYSVYHSAEKAEEAAVQAKKFMKGRPKFRVVKAPYGAKLFFKWSK